MSDVEAPRFARFYPVARVAHLERLAEMVPGDFIYERTRGDWDATLASNLPRVRKLSTLQVFKTLWQTRYQKVEIAEPFAIALLPQAAAIALIMKARRYFERDTQRRLVTYAIENFDPVAKLRSRLPIPRWILTPSIRALASIVLSETTKIAFGTTGARDLYAKHFPKLTSCELSQPASMVFEALPAPAESTSTHDRDVACFLGSFEFRKGIRDLIEAWPHVAASRPGSRLVIIGHGDLLPEVLDFVSRRDDVALHIDPSRTFIRDTLAEAHALVLPSRRTPSWREQVGLPLLEGLSAGCEIVTTDETGIASWLRDHGHQVITERSDLARELAGALTNALNSSRDAGQIRADLPAEDSRIAADLWMFSP